MPDPTSAPQFVFAYGSLVTAAPGAFLAVLPAHRRAWTVAMDNRRAIPGYKRYVDPLTGDTPAVFVAFLDLAPDPRAEVNGQCVPVTDARLAALDRRERNYERVDVTDLIPEPHGRVWTYRGSAGGRARARTGAREGSLTVARGYAEAVRAGFAALGEEELRRFTASTDPPPPSMLADLLREDLAPEPPGAVTSRSRTR
ncbi:MAG: hypothetical protein JWP18_1595 [Solirubrobacterales bacterium]|nr:hypothetical protein [Solirubrobacterales bacterium]